MRPINLNKLLRDKELHYIKKALLNTDNNIAKAASLLGLKRTALSMRLKGLNIEIIRESTLDSITTKVPYIKPRKIVEVKNRIHSNLIRSINDLEGTL
jgi:hypothetical protein